MQTIRRSVIGALAAFATTATVASSATVDPVVQLEKTLLARYPAVAGPLLGSAPFATRELRFLYAVGAVSVWYQTASDRSQVCVAARGNTPALRNAMLGQIMPDAARVRFWASRGISPARAASTFRAGILRACALRGG